MRTRWLLALVCFLLMHGTSLWAQEIIMASTTSTQQSGLFAHLLPEFKMATGIEVKVVALGTGQALDMARRGDADVLFVHDRQAEERFVAEGFGLRRYAVMFNDFVLIGPKDDPAAVKGNEIAPALKKIADRKLPFVSRGDHSGTHAAELRYWDEAGVRPRASAYRECGCSMGAALNMAAGSAAYVLADRGTWLNFKNRADLRILVQGDRRLMNQYGVIVVNPAKHPHVRAALAQRFVDWVISAAGQERIAAYKIQGEQVFFPNAKP